SGAWQTSPQARQASAVPSWISQTPVAVAQSPASHTASQVPSLHATSRASGKATRQSFPAPAFLSVARQPPQRPPEDKLASQPLSAFVSHSAQSGALAVIVRAVFWLASDATCFEGSSTKGVQSTPPS